MANIYVSGCTAGEALRRAQIFAAAKIGSSGGARGFLTEGEVLARL